MPTVFAQVSSRLSTRVRLVIGNLGGQRRQAAQPVPPNVRFIWTRAAVQPPSAASQSDSGQRHAHRVLQPAHRRRREAVNRATCRTPLPAVSAVLALSIFARAIGGRPNRTFAFRRRLAREVFCPAGSEHIWLTAC